MAAETEKPSDQAPRADRGDFGWVPLHVATWDGNDDAVVEILSASRDTLNLRERTFGMTPLHIAVWRGHVDVVRTLLLRFRADCESRDHDEWTPLLYAARRPTRPWRECDDIVTVLVRARACIAGEALAKAFARMRAPKEKACDTVVAMSCEVDPLQLPDQSPGSMTEAAQPLEVPTAARNENGESRGWEPLHIAAWNGDNLRAIEILCDSKSSLNAKETQFGMSALHIAAWRGHPAVLEILLHFHPECESRDLDGQTPMYYAMRQRKHPAHRSNEIVALLVLAKACVLDRVNGSVAGDGERIADLPEANNNDVSDSLALHAAAEAGNNLRTIEILRSSTLVLDSQEEKLGMTPLQTAVSNGHLSAVLILLQFRADCEVRDHDEATALHHAAQQPDGAFAAALIEHRAVVNVFCNAGYTPLSEAAYYSRDEAVALLLKARACIRPAGSGTGDALAAARIRQKRSANIAENLANVLGTHAEPQEAGAEIEEEEPATKRRRDLGNIAAMGALMSHFCPSGGKEATLKYRDRKGRSLLHHASLADSQDAVRLLLAEGIDCEARDEFECTPLFVAAMHNRLHALRMLLQHRADINVKALFDDSTPLHQGTFYGWNSVVQLLLTQQAETGMQDRHGATALYYAASKGREDLLKLILQAGAQIHLMSVKGWTALSAASFRNHAAAVRLLLVARADHSVPDTRGALAVHYSAGEGNKDVLECLLEAGADKDAKDNDGRTPMDYAKKFGRSNLVSMLLCDRV